MYPIERIFLNENDHEADIICAGSKFLITQSDFEMLDLCEGEDIDEEKYEQLCEADNRLSCIKKAFTHLSYGDMSSKKLYNKLRKRFDKEIAADVVELLKEHNYLDDSSLAERYAENFYEFKLWGPLRIKNNLYSRGFSREDIDQACLFLDGTDHRENILKLINKKFGNNAEIIIEQKQKVCAYLYRMGYVYSDITDVINSME